MNDKIKFLISGQKTLYDIFLNIGIAIVVLSFVIVNWIGDILLTKGPK
jgi:hypothetical protein